MKKINIIYRGCNLESPNESLRTGRPKGFDKTDCFYTLHRAIENSTNIGKIFIIIDGDRGYLSDYIESLGYEIIYINVRSNEKSLEYCYDLASSLKDSNNIYFIEDDYWHTEDAIDIINEGVNDLGLVTGYDHLDRYVRNDDITFGQEKIVLTKSRHWRTAESTTCTWASSREVFNKISFIAKNELLNDRRFFRNLITNLNIRLFTPIPSVSTHLMA
jgi:hypothetical protein